MNIEEFIKQLPEKPDPNILSWVMSCDKDELGGEATLFSRQPLILTPDMLRIMDMFSYEDYEKNTRHVWGAVCTCSVCGEEYTARFISVGRLKIRGIGLIEGEDGQLYEGYSDDCPGMVEIAEGDSFFCPVCGEKTKLIHSSDLRQGRTFQLLVSSVENIGRYTTVITWMITRRLDSYGYFLTTVRPREAIAIDGRRLVRFSHTSYGRFSESDLGCWEHRKNYKDPQFIKYYDWPSCCHKKVGGLCYPKVPDLEGTTGEKTGLAEYIAAGGNNPYLYLQLWRAHPNIENLLKAGWGKTVVSGIAESAGNQLDYKIMPRSVELDWIDWEQTKPHRMLMMSKEDLRAGAGWNWDWRTASEWKNCVYYGLNGGRFGFSASDFQKYIEELEFNGVSLINGMVADGYEEFELPKVSNYLRKQTEKGYISRMSEGVQLLIDYREAMCSLAMPDVLITHEQYWPRNLFRAHESMTGQMEHLKDNDYQKGFDLIVEKYGCLEWTDGDLCIRLPRKNSELIYEGNTLRHCVGGYGRQHISESDVIFFVRHYRRPERSYYTLDIRFTKGKPREVQLHGYGNERHGDCKQHKHSIPKKVRDFCDRWEREVLMKWYKDKDKKPTIAGNVA